jgi:hypothetical protein
MTLNATCADSPDSIYCDNIGSSSYSDKASFADKSDKTGSFRCEPIELLIF